MAARARPLWLVQAGQTKGKKEKGGKGANRYSTPLTQVAQESRVGGAPGRAETRL